MIQNTVVYTVPMFKIEGAFVSSHDFYSPTASPTTQGMTTHDSLQAV